jgi:hypothetical protein
MNFSLRERAKIRSSSIAEINGTLSWEFLIIHLISLTPCSTFKDMECIRCKDELREKISFLCSCSKSSGFLLSGGNQDKAKNTVEINQLIKFLTSAGYIHVAYGNKRQGVVRGMNVGTKTTMASWVARQTLFLKMSRSDASADHFIPSQNFFSDDQF